MKNDFGRLPVFVKLSAWALGSPLLALGAALMYSDVSETLRRAHSVAASEHSGLAIGPFFLLVGASIVWPVRPFQS